MSAWVILILLSSCSNQSQKENHGQQNFNKDINLLTVDYINKPDETISNIIKLSGIQKEGYGILLNINNHLNSSKIDTLKRKFQKHDVNAIHSFNIRLPDSISQNIFVALEGAKFTWIFSNELLDYNNIGKQLSASLKKSINKGGLIVAGDNLKALELILEN